MRQVAVAALSVAFLVAGRATARAGDRVEYNRDVRPILSENCFACHGPDQKKRKGKLRLDLRDDALQDRGGYAAIVPHKPDESELVARIEAEDPTEKMPPAESHKSLTASQIDVLKRWVAQGAEYQAHWAYMPLARPAVPALKDAKQVHNPIDAFVQKELAARDLHPSPEADRRTLLRRLSLDVIGLPPSPEQVRDFLADASPNAYEAQVDRLLGSPQFGERMAQHWLDVARYADTVGFHGDQNHNAWAYRDYVIEAFNKNKPFDQFTVEQLAGDLLPNPTTEQRVATCFNRLNMMTREGGAQPKEYLAKYSADRIRTVGMAWLGSTFNCAECHDHKFDPITQKDFYSLGAFFADVKQWGVYSDYEYTPNPDLKGWSNDHPFPPEIVVESPALVHRLQKLRGQIAAVVRSAEPSAPEFDRWTQETKAFLTRCPTGWDTPVPEVQQSDPSPAKKAKRRPAPAGKAAEPSPAAAETGGKTEDKPRFCVGDDGRVHFEPGPAATAEFALKVSPGWISAVRIELLPDAKHQNKLVRSGDRTTVRPSFAIVSQDGKSRPLAIRHAQADRYAPRYDDGFEFIGVQSAWLTDPKAADRAHTAVYFLDRPVRVNAEDVVKIRFADNLAACLRVSVSPLAPPDVQHPCFPDPSCALLDDTNSARALYLRSTAWNGPAFDRVKALEAEVLACRDGKTPVMVTERTDKPLTIRVLARGNWMDESGEICQPSTPHFLPGLPNSEGRTLTRLDLARWLCSAENPLTPRAITNRLWKQFFGNGLSAQVDDLGVQGEPPSHPELLDWLAAEFRDSGWDVKHLVKLIVMSHTYRQTSKEPAEVRELDPSNRLLSSQNPRRLEAEVVRDNVLAIAGLLNLERGGPPCHPYQPANYYAGLQFPDRVYTPETDDRQWRRGVYTHWQRTFLHPMLANFDAPSREDCIAMRVSANSPQQALTLLNDPSFVEAARVWAAHLLATPAKCDADRLDRALEQALARPIKPSEQESLLAFLDRMRTEYRARPDDAAKLLKVGVAPAPEGDAVELAAWTNLCRVILNLHETITRF